ncbi:putative sporulation protein YyaC [Oikeobacillus pervagus]|uniref:Sporulation protein YyaC n=1 Tax=Oikeobacillus pervagus TaxID=1325931 RepID=A0AAJ1SZ09_9BACI|nr:spore protease YyaC [Oikeobacillus pervagus]MDQ0215408.1 putative sporulation protein YyaC [Oikeobacillus pervagus]
MKLKGIFDRKPEPMRVEYTDHIATKKISHEILSLLPASAGRPIIFVCIGTDRSTGDSLGPLTGTFLAESELSHFHIYGTLDDPVHAVNLQEKLDSIHKEHVNPFIIGVDACLGKLKSVGIIQIANGPVKPGAGVQKELPPVGEAHITGIVNVSGFMEFFVLQNTRLNLVMKMAKIISKSIVEVSRKYQRRLELHPLVTDEERTL